MKTWKLYMKPLLSMFLAPVDNAEEPLQFQVALLDYNDYVGRIGIGRVFRGTMKVGQQFLL
jgi:GTP-binding protein